MADENKGTGRALRWLLATEKRAKANLLEPEYVRPRLVCNDGFSLSLQSGPKHFCSLRNPTEGTMPVPSPYEDAEIWKTRAADGTDYLEPLLAEYGDGDDPYGWVPLALVDEVILVHGGVLGDPKKRNALAQRNARSLDMGNDQVNLSTVVRRPRAVRIG